MSQRIAYAQQYYNTYSGIELPEEIDTELDGENKIKMQNMITEAIRIANDDSYRYSQPLRNSEFYYDCSSFVSRLYQKYFNNKGKIFLKILHKTKKVCYNLKRIF